ncbi:DUF6531 domain-containing protein [Cupriavidus basilensis]
MGGLLGAKLGGMIGGRAPGEPNKSAERDGVKDETATNCKDPIDVATGEMVEIRTDVSIPGVLPLVLTRRYRTRSDDEGLLGPRWSTNWSQRLRLDEGRLVRFFDGGGLTITFEAPDADLNGINLREPRYRLEGTRTAPRVLDDETRHILWFAPLVDGAVSRIERIEDWSGNAIAGRVRRPWPADRAATHDRLRARVDVSGRAAHGVQHYLARRVGRDTTVGRLPV